MTIDDLIYWDETSQKWSDRQNDHWCMANPSGGWLVAARYGFEDGSYSRRFDSQEEAEGFYRLFILMRHHRK